MQSSRVTDVPGLQYCWKVGSDFLAGQPSPESFDQLKALGVRRVFNLRGEGEADFSWEIQKCKDLGLEYVHIPIVVGGVLNRENCLRLSNMVGQASGNFIHCASANRVGGWFVTYLTMFQDMDFDEAVDIAMSAGLSNPAFVSQAEAVIEENG